jgi:hypothetical protein
MKIKGEEQEAQACYPKRKVRGRFTAMLPKIEYAAKRN